MLWKLFLIRFTDWNAIFYPWLFYVKFKLCKQVTQSWVCFSQCCTEAYNVSSLLFFHPSWVPTKAFTQFFQTNIFVFNINNLNKNFKGLTEVGVLPHG